MTSQPSSAQSSGTGITTITIALGSMDIFCLWTHFINPRKARFPESPYSNRAGVWGGLCR